MNMNIQKISLVFMFICIIALFVENRNMNIKFKSLENFGNDNIEHLDNTDEDRVRAIIKEEYTHDIEAIRNLGIISKSLLTGKNYHNTSPTDLQNNTLTIPANVNTLGNSNINGNFVVEGTFNLLPAGCIIMWGQEKIPSGWQKCNGTGTYTNADGETKEIPDLRGRFVLGEGQGSGLTNRTLNESGPENGIPNYPKVDDIFTAVVNFTLYGGAKVIEVNPEEGKEAKPNEVEKDKQYKISQLGTMSKINWETIGWIDNDTGIRNGGEVHKLTIGQMPEHRHKVLRVRSVMTGNNYGRWYVPQPGDNGHNIGSNYFETDKTGEGQHFNNIPPYYVLIYIIKVY